MGLLSQRGEDDEEQGDVSIAGLEHLDGGSTDETTYELDEWSDHDRAILRDRLESLGLPHRWEGSTLIVSPVDEAWAERVMDQVDEELNDAEVAEDEDEQVAYDLSGWDDDACMALLDSLSAEAIPYALDDQELFVAAPDEARVDELVEAIVTPGAGVLLGGPVSFEAMGDMFVAADRLVHDHEDSAGSESMLRNARVAAVAAPPYGMEQGWWDGVVARAGALADLLESPTPDGDLVHDLATALRDDLRPYI